MSKYTEYREIAGKMETTFIANISDAGRQVKIELDPVLDNLHIRIQGRHDDDIFTVEGDAGEALFKALKQIYE
jgi:hypothetical protein